jgi:hypothetical protein
MQTLEEKRKHQRSLCYLNAIEGETGEVIGHVGDIHHEGLTLISEHEIPLDDVLPIVIETLGEEVRISLIIKGIWNLTHEEPKHYRTGCQIINPSSMTIDAIYKLIEALKNGGRNPFKHAVSMRTE